MINGTKRLKRAAQDANRPLRKFARLAAANNRHPLHKEAVTWLRRKEEDGR